MMILNINIRIKDGILQTKVSSPRKCASVVILQVSVLDVMDVTQTKYYLQIDGGAFPTEDKFLSPSISLTN